MPEKKRNGGRPKEATEAIEPLAVNIPVSVAKAIRKESNRLNCSKKSIVLSALEMWFKAQAQARSAA